LGTVLIAGFMSAGCISSKKITTENTESTGQQLIDLDKAYNDGIITQEQYEKLKRRVIRKND
jgi:hypothetical protein